MAKGEKSDRRLARWALQSAARELMPGELVAKCLRKVVPGQKSVDVCYSEKVHRAHYKKLQVCGSVWMCPICSAKITERRRVELSEAIGKNDSLQVALVTFTLQHDQGDKLSNILGVLLDSYRFLKAGKRWLEFQKEYGLVGSIRSLEVTFGENGAHPHLHVLAFFTAGVDFLGVSDFYKERWVDILSRHERSASLKYGVDFRFAEKDVVDYVAKHGKQPVNLKSPFKWGVEHELAKGPAKVSRSVKGRSPLQLLADYLAGDSAAGSLWKEYARCFKGKRQLVWSRGLRRVLGLDREESDEEIAKKEDEAAVLLATLSMLDWRVVLANDARGELLEVASSGDVTELRDFCLSLGCDLDLDRRRLLAESIE